MVEDSDSVPPWTWAIYYVLSSSWNSTRDISTSSVLPLFCRSPAKYVQRTHTILGLDQTILTATFTDTFLFRKLDAQHGSQHFRNSAVKLSLPSDVPVQKLRVPHHDMTFYPFSASNNRHFTFPTTLFVSFSNKPSEIALRNVHKVPNAQRIMQCTV